MCVHETNLTPSGKRQGCHGEVTIQRRVKEAAMLPLSPILIACLHFFVFLSISLKVDLTRMLFPSCLPS